MAKKWEITKDGTLKIHQKIGKLTLAKLLEGIHTVQVSKSVFNSMPKKYWKVLENMNIKVIVKNDKKGRKPLDCSFFERISKCKEEGISIRRCSSSLGISRRSFYNLKKRCS